MIEQGLHVVAGVDLGDKHSHVCLIDLDGNIAERGRESSLSFARSILLLQCRCYHETA